VARQILFGIYSRSRRGSQTRLEKLQQVVDFLRQFEPVDLKLLGDVEIPPKWPKACRPLLKTIMLTSRYCDATPEEFKNTNVWPGYVFGRGSKLDFRGISQPWLRGITRAWCWDNLNRFNTFCSLIKTVNEIEYFSEYLRTTASAAGEDIYALDRSTVCGFAEYVAAQVRAGNRRNRSKRPDPGDPWTHKMRYTCLLAVQRILKYGRESDRMGAFAGSFIITDDLVVASKPALDRDSPGDALPVGVLRQLFSAESLQRLSAMNADLVRLVRIAAETGRRPGEVVSLHYCCLDVDSVGGPYLLYTESKVSGGQQRRLPVLDVVVDAVHEQQVLVRQRFPGISSTELRLFPRPTMNPRGLHPFSSATLGKNLRTWIDGLPRLDSGHFAADGQPVPYPRASINAYSFRHSYAQRHADAGTPPDVLRELMGHEKIETTMGYYRIPQKRRREAAEIVGNLMFDGDTLIIGSMGRAHRLADQRPTIAVPFGKCSNPQNVAAEGYGCPIRHRCFGCASFASDPSYLPEMRRRLLDLKATRARVDAFRGAAEWAKRDARPSDDEIDALQRLIRVEEDKLAHATEEQRALINDASAVLRKARALGQVALTLRRPSGEDALHGHRDDRRHTVEVVGQAFDG
jgi:integrase